MVLDIQLPATVSCGEPSLPVDGGLSFYGAACA